MSLPSVSGAEILTFGATISTDSTTSSTSVPVSTTTLTETSILGISIPHHTFAVRDAARQRELWLYFESGSAVRGEFTEPVVGDETTAFTLNEYGNLVHVSSGLVACGEDGSYLFFINLHSPQPISPICNCSIDAISSELSCACGGSTRICLLPPDPHYDLCNKEDTQIRILRGSNVVEAPLFAVPNIPLTSAAPSLTQSTIPTASTTRPNIGSKTSAPFHLVTLRDELFSTSKDVPFIDVLSALSFDIWNYFALDDTQALIDMNTGFVAAVSLSGPSQLYPVKFYSRKQANELALQIMSCVLEGDATVPGFHRNGLSFCFEGLGGASLVLCDRVHKLTLQLSAVFV